jgi:acetoin utilization protein AcuB
MAVSAEEVMTKKLFTLPETAKIQEVLELMDEHRIRHVPILNSKDEVIGIADKEHCLLMQASPDLMVRDFVDPEIEWVRAETPLRSAILRMLSTKVNVLLVEGIAKKAIGIVTADDLMWFLAHTLDKNEHKKVNILTLFDIESLDEVATQISMTGI